MLVRTDDKQLSSLSEGQMMIDTEEGGAGGGVLWFTQGGPHGPTEEKTLLSELRLASSVHVLMFSNLLQYKQCPVVIVSCTPDEGSMKTESASVHDECVCVCMSVCVCNRKRLLFITWMEDEGREDWR